MSVIDKVVTSGGDLSKLSSDERALYYKEVCESLGLNPLTEPFKYITLNGKLQLYATKAATEQLRKINGISLTIVSSETVGDVYIVRVRATNKESRGDESTGAVSIAGLKGDSLANAIMKTETKAKRRVTLSISGLGFLDESEVETIPGNPIVFSEPPAIKPEQEIKQEFTEETERKPVKESETVVFEVVLMGTPRKKNGQDILGVQAVIASPSENEGEVELLAPISYKDILTNGAALTVEGILQDGKLEAVSVKPIAGGEGETADNKEQLENTITLLATPKPGTITYKGENLTRPFAACKYPGNYSAVFAVGEALKSFTKNDILEIVIADQMEKDGKLMLFVKEAKKISSQQQAG